MFDRIKIIELPTLCDAYKATVHNVDMKNRITHKFMDADKKNQEEFMTDQYNKRNKQGVLFL